jgi:tetratricopeptide (TPR) repeat protein
VNDSTITLRSGQVLGAGSCKNPICVVANYLFDTLYHDIFQVDGGELKEGLVSTGSKHKEEPDPLDPEIIKRLSNKYQYNTVSSDYYKDEDGDEIHMERILQWYKDCFGDNVHGASIVFPIGALRALRRLSAFSNNKAIVISGDKGNNNPEQFVGLMDPHIAVHGSFSLMVNYHAVGAYFTSRGGFALHNPQEEASLKVGCFVLDGSSHEEALSDSEWLKAPEGKEPKDTPFEFNGVVGPGEPLGPSLQVEPQVKAYRGSSTTISVDMVNNLAAKDDDRSNAYPYLKLAFEDAINIFGPNDFFVLQKTLKEDCPNPPLKSVVSLLKLGDWDPDVFFKFRDAMLNQISNCGQKLRNDIIRGVPRVWENYYMLDLDKDIAFEIGRFFYGIRDYTNALHFYVESTSTIGEHHVTYHNQGLCHYSRGYLTVALAHFEKAVSLNADYEKARNWIEKVKKEMAQKSEEAAADVDAEKAAKDMVENVMANMSLASDLPPIPPASSE